MEKALKGLFTGNHKRYYLKFRISLLPSKPSSDAVFPVSYFLSSHLRSPCNINDVRFHVRFSTGGLQKAKAEKVLPAGTVVKRYCL